MKSNLVIKITASAAIIAILLYVFIPSGDDSSEFKPAPPDTVKTAITYIEPKDGGGRLDIVFRIAKDTFYLDSVAPATFKQISRRDSFYYVPVVVAARDSTGEVIKDSTGKTVPFVEYRLLAKELLLEDYNRRY